ncbi:AraC family transcriptional regulator [Pseudotenacibaculum sp. MALMAid0570]|uniref:helix-turn-helix domain-containing protein n=1 Tax=Pseudotenacibaculum sp. MALMAid0570 TaxID=3143938 RepID=UPI0032DF1D79
MNSKKIVAYKEEIVHFSEPKSQEFFPDKFSNEIYYSDVKNGTPLKYTSSFSIKYVLEGFEQYGVGKNQFKVNKNQYLLINDDQTVENLHSNAKALSIFLDKTLVNNVLANVIYSQEHLLDNPFLTQNESICFFENIYPKNDMLGVYLDMFFSHYVCHRNFQINEEVFYSFASNLIFSQTDILRKINSIQRVKYATRCELFKRASLAKVFIEENIHNDFNLDLLSKASFLSKYHLIRVFKTVFKTTPYNYYLSLKIQKSKHYLKNTNLTVTDIACLSGFSDAISFSKRFKLITGLTPMKFKAAG